VTGGQVIEVANCDRWPGYRSGQLYSFHRIIPVRVKRTCVLYRVSCREYVNSLNKDANIVWCCSYQLTLDGF
jgi:hypothetical protein